MTLKLYGAPISTCTKRVLTTLKEKNIDFEFVPIDLSKGEQKAASFLEKQPWGVVPYIDDDGFVLYESRAICRYLEAKYKNQGTELIPTDLQGLGLFEQGASIETSYFDSFACPIVVERLFKPMRGLQPDEKRVEDLIALANKNLDIYDKILSKQDYISGSKFTLADLFHLPYGSLLFVPSVGVGNLITDRPHVRAWWERITSRQSWKEVNQS